MTPLILLIIGILIGLYPFISMILATLISKILNIELNEGYVSNYYIGKWNVGETLYGMFVSMWLMIFTIPLGLIIVLSAGLWAICI